MVDFSASYASLPKCKCLFHAINAAVSPRTTKEPCFSDTAISAFRSSKAKTTPWGDVGRRAGRAFQGQSEFKNDTLENTDGTAEINIIRYIFGGVFCLFSAAHEWVVNLCFFPCFKVDLFLAAWYMGSIFIP